MDESEVPDPALFPERVGERLRAARLKAGIDLSDVATRTRIPLRHLTAIENGNYGELPAPTYCVGFVKSYARAVGADEVSLAHDVRTELGLGTERASEFVDYDAADPARVPPRWLAFAALALAVLVGGGYAMLKNGFFDGASSNAVEATATNEGDPATGPGDGTGANAIAAPAPTAGQVVLTATDVVWLRIYDKNDKTIVMKEMKAGEAYAVPANVDTPMIKTRLPHKINVTIAGKAVAALGDKEKLLKDMVLTPASLAARPAQSTAPPTANSVQPGPGGASRP
jgi:cytoskeleton protein RodZ